MLSWTRSMGEMINSSGQELFAALGEFAEVGLR
jgi:hypothetical protein